MFINSDRDWLQVNMPDFTPDDYVFFTNKMDMIDGDYTTATKLEWSRKQALTDLKEFKKRNLGRNF